MAIAREKINFLIGALTLVVALLLLAAYLLVMPSSNPTLPTTTLTIGETTIIVELATTPSEQEQGLSGRVALAPNAGMFFVFDHPDKWGIWMKDMRFPIDILWADENGMIITIEHEVQPSSYPTAFYPTTSASYVLELPSGFAAARGLAIGQQIVVK